MSSKIIIGDDNGPRITVGVPVPVPSGSGSDTTAIHVDQSNEITGITEEASPVGTEKVVVENAAGAKRSVALANFPTAGGGEVNILVNDGTAGESLVGTKVGSNLGVLGAEAGANITITPNLTNKTLVYACTASGSGDVVGPASSTDNAVARYDLATGKLLQNSAVTIDDSGNIATSGTVDGVDISTDSSTNSSHRSNTANPHATDVGNLGSGTLAELNTAITDATLDTSSASRTPSGSASGDLTGTYPSPTVVQANLDPVNMDSGSATNTQVPTANGSGGITWANQIGGGGSGDVVGPASATDNAVARYDTTTGKLLQNSAATIDDSGNIATSGTVDGRDVAADGTAQDSHIADTANPHATDIENLGSGTLAELNAAVTDATLDTSSASRTPTSHASSHQNGGSDEIATATAGANAIPKAGAGSTLDNAWVADGADATAIHDDTAGEITAIALKGTPTGSDVILIEDSADSSNKKRITVGSLPTGGGGEANTTSNSGGGEGAALAKVGIDLPFKSFTGTNGITASNTATEIDFTPTYGAAANTVTEGDDSRLSDARTPTSHAASHQNGGSDEIATATAGANAIPKAGGGGTLDNAWVAAGADSSAIHDDTAGEISAVALKALPTSSDFLLIEDAADLNNKKRITIGTIPLADHVLGPASSTDNAVARFDSTTGKLIQNSVVTIDDSGNIATAGTVDGRDVSTDGAAQDSHISAAFPHSGTLANLNSAVTDATLDDVTGNRTDADAIHDNVAAEISAITEKTTPVAADLLIIEDSADSNNKKRLQISNIPPSTLSLLADGTRDLTGDMDVSTDVVVNDSLAGGWDGSLLQSAAITVTESAGTVSLNIEREGGGDLGCRIGNSTFIFDTTPAESIALTAGTDTVFVESMVWLEESLGVVTLNTGATFPSSGQYCAVAHVVVQSAASVAIDGAILVHGWRDHIVNGDNGHIAHISQWIRQQHATWRTGVAAASLVVSGPNAYASTSAGVVFQLHNHTMPARDMQTGDPIYLVNDPTTAYKRITTFDDITQDAVGGAINNRHFSLVLWGVVSEVEADCKLMLNLPSGTYNNSAAAEADADGYADYNIPTAFKGAGFLVARYVVQGKDSGAWVENALLDIRGLFPATTASGGTGITDHGALSGLADDDHTQYLLVDGTRAMTGALDMGTAAITNVGNVDGRDVSADGTAQDSHIADLANPHATDIENLGSGTLAELNAAITDATLDDSSSTRAPTNHASSHQNGGADEIATATAAANAIPKAGAGSTLDNAWIADGADATAIHDNVAAEISAVTLKATPVTGDILLIEDSADSNNKKRVTIGTLPTGSDADAIHDNVAAEISAITEKTTPISADLIIIEDSADSNSKKRVQIGNLPGGSGSSTFNTFTFFADQLRDPNTTDFTISAAALSSPDSNNDGITTALYDDTTEEGKALEIVPPEGATSLVIGLSSRAETAPGAARTAGLKFYHRNTLGTPGSWTAGTQLTDIDIDADEAFNKDTQTITLSGESITVGEPYQFMFTRVAPSGGTNLTGDWGVMYYSLGWLGTNSVNELATRQYFAGQFILPVTSDFAISAIPASAQDTNNDGLNVLLFDDTTEEAVVMEQILTADATDIRLDLTSRAETAPGGVRTIGLKLRHRIISDGTPGSWSTATQLADLDIPASELFVQDTAQFSLASESMTAGKTYQIMVSRVAPLAGTDLTGDWVLQNIVFRVL
jgi:hypothetical protein